MSLQAEKVAWAFIQEHRPRPAVALVLLRLAWHHREKTGKCFPSVDTLATETGLARSTVLQALGWLDTHGAITRVPRSRDGLRGGRRSDQYDFDGLVHEPSLDCAKVRFTTIDGPELGPERSKERPRLNDNGTPVHRNVWREGTLANRPRPVDDELGLGA